MWWSIPAPGQQNGIWGDIRNHLSPNLGVEMLTKVTPSDVQGMEAAMLAKGLSPRSVQHAHRVLSEAYKHAIAMGLAWQNPCSSVRPPRQVRPELTIPDVPIVLDLLKRAKATHYGVAIHLLLFTGMRRGEVCGLTWEDCDLERAIIMIRGAASRAKGQGVTMLPPKTDKGRRSITIDPATVSLLREHKGAHVMQQIEEGGVFREDSFVFVYTTSAMLMPQS